MTTLAHSRPALTPVIVQVNLDISALFWPLFALCWLGWLAFQGLQRALSRLWELGRAIAVVSARRIRRWLRGNQQRFAWQLSGLMWGPVLGCG
jgi:hypothetical protein